MKEEYLELAPGELSADHNYYRHTDGTLLKNTRDHDRGLLAGTGYMCQGCYIYDRNQRCPKVINHLCGPVRSNARWPKVRIVRLPTGIEIEEDET